MRPKQEWSIAEVESRLRQQQQDIAAAKQVVIIGGGPTGIEMAGEIAAAHPGKKITLIHRQPRLLDDRFPIKLSNQLEALLQKAGVQLVLGDEHIQEPDLVTGKQNGTRTIRTKKGKQLPGESSLQESSIHMLILLRYSRLCIHRHWQSTQHSIGC